MSFSVSIPENFNNRMIHNHLLDYPQAEHMGDFEEECLKD